MNEIRYTTPNSFLSAYHSSRGESAPSLDAHQWLKSLIERRFGVDAASYRYAESVLQRAAIDVEDVAQNFLGANLFLSDLQSFDKAADAPVFGCVRPASRTINVCFRAQAYQPLYRSTVVHEVAHLMLHAGPFHATHHYAPTSSRRPSIEREADRFMAETLLPQSILYLAVTLALHDRGMQPGEAFRAANSDRGRWQWRYIYFPFFLDRLCLSRELVAVRMVEHGTFDRSTFDYHRTYAIPNRWRRPSALSFGAIATAAYEAMVA